ncbi:MAG TPA: transglutaminase domain-containing protein [Kofleriaceae bacterium]|jgi:hypothetical protein
MASKVVRVVRLLVVVLLKTLWVGAMIAVPLFGFWLASSLAAYSNASVTVALLVGLALFPLAPVAWELVARWRRTRNGDETRSVLTTLDRLVLRTLLLNGLFLGFMIWRKPEVAFRAMAVRGDWFLDGNDGDVANTVRSGILWAADHFEQRWHKQKTENGTSDAAPTDVTGGSDTAWPLPAQPDAQATVPDEVATSPDAVGKFLALRITDKRRLAKAVHDYVILRLHYDRPTFEHRDDSNHVRPSQQANDVFAAKTGVCEGYARLYEAIGRAAGLDVAYVTGFVRGDRYKVPTEGTDEAIKTALEGYGHAWNAVKIDGLWLLVDTTWDDMDDSGTGDATAMRTTYLFTPPQWFRRDHLPELPQWQLTAPVLTAGSFARQPMMDATAGAIGVDIVDPVRSQIDVDGDAEVTLTNPRHAAVLATLSDLGQPSNTGTECVVRSDGDTTHVRCATTPGQHVLTLFGAPAGEHQLWGIGTVLVNRR